MKKVLLLAIFLIALSFTSCTDLLEDTNEQQTENAPTVDPTDDGTVETEDPEDDGEG